MANTPVIGAGSTVTAAYGINISAQKVAGVTTGYGVYQSGAADVNSFAGPTTFLNSLNAGGHPLAFNVGTGAIGNARVAIGDNASPDIALKVMTPGASARPGRQRSRASTWARTTPARAT